MKKPAGTITLSSEEGEVLIAQVHQSNVPTAVAGRVEQIIRMYFWVVFALQETKITVSRLRRVLFGKAVEAPTPAPVDPPTPTPTPTPEPKPKRKRKR